MSVLGRARYYVGRVFSEAGREMDLVAANAMGLKYKEVSLSRHQPIQSLGSHVPTVSLTTYVAPSATVIGNVTIGRASSVGFGSTLRGDVNNLIVGDRVFIGDSVTIHVTREGLRAVGFETLIGHDVVVGSGSTIHGCTLEDGCVIGESSNLLDGSVIGAEAKLAPGSLVLEGTRIGARQLWSGAPAKFERDLTEAELTELRAQKANLTQLAEKHLNWQKSTDKAQLTPDAFAVKAVAE